MNVSDCDVRSLDSVLDLSRIVIVAALGLGTACAKAPAKQEVVATAPNPDASPDRTPVANAEKSASGLASIVLKPGTGDKRPELHDKVRVNFSGWNEKGLCRALEWSHRTIDPPRTASLFSARRCMVN